MPYEYQVGGSLKFNAPSYVTRRADADLYDTLMAGEFCYVFNARQMGKSSLRVRMRQQLQQQGMHCASLDMTSIGSDQLTPQQWYKSLAADLLRSFNLWRQVNFKQWWADHEGIAPLRRLSLLLEEVVLVQLPVDRLFIFVDEVDSALAQPFPLDDFFAFIRFCYNQRAENPEYRRLTWALFGVTTPSDLICDRARTPFNIGRGIELQGFQEDEVQPLVDGLAGYVSQPQAVLREIVYWTGGQPFLTQKLCQLAVASNAISPGEGVVQIPPGMESYWVEQLVRSHITQHWESHDQPEHLRTIRDRILRHESMTVRLLGIYQQILFGQEVPLDDSPEQMELLLSGLVVKHQGALTVKNPIYKTVFNDGWVRENLAMLRPYARKLHAWLESVQQDRSQLLRGVELKAALNWAENQQLGDQDYRFLSASQELAKQSVESDLVVERIEHEKASFALQAAQDAHELLAMARRTAKEQARGRRLTRRWMLGVATGVAVFIYLLRGLGLLQTLEWLTLDRFFLMRPAAGMDSRIVIVEVSESDLQAIGRHPVPDQVLSQAIETIKQYQPRAIGLDIYRDLPVEPGRVMLLETFKTTPNLIGIDKVVRHQVDAPPILRDTNRVGFSDQILDVDGKVRRALLSIRRSNGELRVSLALRLALDYLAAEGIIPQARGANPSNLQLGKANLVPFAANDGGYVRAASGGYQILLNYHGISDRFHTISLSNLLAQRFSPEFFRDRVILIGYTADSINDMFQTPYSTRLTGVPSQMPGIVIHANIVSHLLSAALGEQSLLRTWSEPIEWVWIFCWAGAGAVLGWRFKAVSKLAASLFVAIVIVLGSTYLLFLQSWWIPVIPAVMAVLASALVLPGITAKHLERIQLKQIVRFLLLASQDRPAAGGIALEYLKQSESREHQQWITSLITSQEPLQRQNMARLRDLFRG